MAMPENPFTVKPSLKAPAVLVVRDNEKREYQRYRTPFMRDRDRILYSSQFRVLSGKTQVYLSGIDDNMRTRLTHTLEVAQIAKTIASSLSLDVDLAEAIALGHDIGHTPYGHAGERILHQIMNFDEKHIIKGCPFDLSYLDDKQLRDILPSTKNASQYLGFKHNLHSLEIAVQESERTQQKMLSLSNFSLYGMLTHSKQYYKDDLPCHDDEEENVEDYKEACSKLGYYTKYFDSCLLGNHFAWSFEAFVVAEADEIAQCHHDLEDAIRGHLITPKAVCSYIRESFFPFFTPKERKRLRDMLKESESNLEAFYSDLSRLIVNLLVIRLISKSVANLIQLIQRKKWNATEFRRYVEEHDESEVAGMISYDEINNKDFSCCLQSFRKQISPQVLSAHEIQKTDAKGQYIIRKLFQALYDNPQQLCDNCVIDYLLQTTNGGSYQEKYQQIQAQIKKAGIGSLRKQFLKDIDDTKKAFEKEKTSSDFHTPVRSKLFILMRTICNYIASMTDKSVQSLYQELYG